MIPSPACAMYGIWFGARALYYLRSGVGRLRPVALDRGFVNSEWETTLCRVWRQRTQNVSNKAGRSVHGGWPHCADQQRYHTSAFRGTRGKGDWGALL